MLPWKKVVRAKTAAALPANTYANGTSGVGATLTGTANGALATVDGVTLAANDRLIVDQEATGSHNGFYVVTQLGDATHPYILTRTADADEPGELVNAAAKVSEGSTFADQEWQCTTNAPITVGTTALVFAAASGGGASLTIKDEGTTLTSAPTAINFTGAGVVASNSGGVVTVTIPGGSTSGDFSNVVLLCGFDGADGATSFTDESSYARVGTFNGDAQLDTGITPAIGTAALLLDGTGDFVSFPFSAQLSVANSDDQTIEGFFRCTNVAGGGTKLNTVVSKRNTSGEFTVQVNSTGVLQFSVFSASTPVASIFGTTTLSNGTWYYFAVVRKFGTWKMFLGTPGGTATVEGTADETGVPSGNSGTLDIGREPSSTTRDFTGTIDEIRWTRKQALYTTAFPVPAAAFPRS
jgi:concanavalin A-like lectin/glucanase superfamily protein